MSEGEPATIEMEAAPFLRFRAAEGWAGSQPVIGLMLESTLDGVLSCETAADALGRVALYEDGAGRLWLSTWARAGWRASWSCCGRVAWRCRS